ncbi:MAG: hypothetical protein GY950_10145, partial [bacterium]|nr:hypothetical protein [bacterium]
MGKEEIFAELDKLLNVPQFERIVIHKLRELEGFLKDEISLYLSIRQRLRNEAYGHMQVCEDDHQGENQTLRVYYFQV